MTDTYITCKEAIARGLKRFFSGKPCKHGHIAFRKTSNNTCLECIRIAAKLYRYKTREKQRENERNWRLKNSAYARAVKAANQRKRRARLRKALGNHTLAEVAAILKAQCGRCIYCFRLLEDDYHVDHIMPLARGGSNDRSNIQVTCEECNHKKYARDPFEFAQSLGRLL